MNKENLNYFSESEKKNMKKFADLRTRFFLPLLKVLDKLSVTPNMISFAAFISIFGFVYFADKNIYYALIFVIPHILLDGIDGALARYQGKSSNKGAFVDICVDQGGVVIAVLAMIYFSLIDPFWGALYAVSYIVMILFVVLLNYMEKSVKYIIRSKYFFYALLFVDAYFKTDSITPFLIILSVYMSLASLYLFNKLRKAIEV